MSAPEVRRATAEDLPAVEAFLQTQEDATVFHRPEWHEVIRATYGHECDYWTAWRGDCVSGVFPVVSVRAPLLGGKMVAMAYQMHSGLPIGDAASSVALVEACAANAHRARSRYVEIRHHQPAPWLEELGFRRIESGLCTTIVPLEGIELGRIRRNHRRSVRSAEEQGLGVSATESLADLRTFNDLYRREARSLGSPVAGWSFFENLRRLAAPCYRLFLARRSGRVIAGLLTVGDDRLTFARLAAYSTPEAMSLRAGAALYWAAISNAAERGCRALSCGLSWIRDEGLIHWKEGWGGTTQPVYMHALEINSAVPAPGGYFEGYGLAKSIWKRLPLPVVDRIGHAVTRWVG